MEYATLIFALPVTIIAWLVMLSFAKALRVERARREGTLLQQLRPGLGVHGPERTLRQRLARIRSYPSKDEVTQFMDTTVQAALSELVDEFTEQDHESRVDVVADNFTGIPSYALSVTIPDHDDFFYQVRAVEKQVPTYGGRTYDIVDVYYRAEVFSAGSGSEGYDLMGETQEQIVHDVLRRYEGHLSFLTHLGGNG